MSFVSTNGIVADPCELAFVEKVLGPFSYARYSVFLPLQNAGNSIGAFQ